MMPSGSHLAWYVGRLRTMSSREILHRVGEGIERQAWRRRKGGWERFDVGVDAHELTSRRLSRLRPEGLLVYGLAWVVLPIIAAPTVACAGQELGLAEKAALPKSALMGLTGGPSMPNGYSYHTSGESYSATNPTPTTFRFELRDGDYWASGGTGSERAEISGPTYPYRTPIEISYKFTVEPGARNDASWTVLGQFHNQDYTSSPPFAFTLKNDADILQINIRNDSTARYGMYPYSAPLQRGHEYDIKAQLYFDTSQNGYAKVWIDGVRVLDYHGPIGYTNSDYAYWKEGIYRSSDGTVTMVADYKDLEIQTPSTTDYLTKDGIVHTDPTSGPDPIPVPTPDPDPTPNPTPDRN